MFYLEAAIHGCSENMEEIYRVKPVPKCDFNKVAKQLILKSHFGMCILL